MNDSQSVNSILDLDNEFANSLSNETALEYALREGIAVDLLNNPRAKAVYQFAHGHFNQTGKAPTADVLQHEFPQFPWKDKVDTPIEWLVDKLRERHKKNRIQDLVTNLARSIDKPDDAMIMLTDEVHELQRSVISNGRVWSKDDSELFIKRLAERELIGGYEGASFGFKVIDDYTGGLKPGQLGYLLARPKRQKTFFMLNTFINQIQRGDKPVFFTLELTGEEVMLRLACMASGFPWDKAQRGGLMPEDRKILKAGLDTLAQWGEYWVEEPPMDERTVDSLRLKAERLGAESVLVSQFKYVTGSKGFYRSPQLEVPAEVAVDLKRAAIMSAKPWIVEAQFNRGGDTMEELEDFDASKVGLTDMIPQAADILFGLFASKELRANQTTEFGILDSRNTGKAAWYVNYEYIKGCDLNIQNDSQH